MQCGVGSVCLAAISPREAGTGIGFQGLEVAFWPVTSGAASGRKEVGGRASSPSARELFFGRSLNFFRPYAARISSLGRCFSLRSRKCRQDRSKLSFRFLSFCKLEINRFSELFTSDKPIERTVTALRNLPDSRVLPNFVLMETLPVLLVMPGYAGWMQPEHF